MHIHEAAGETPNTVNASIDQIVYRLANPPSVSAALADLPVSLEDALETLDLFELKTAEDATTLFRNSVSRKPVL